MRTRLYVAMVVTALITVACGSPTKPSEESVSGSWSGTLASSNFQTLAMTAQLTQAGTSITGTWAASIVDWSGTVTGTTSNGSFTGTMTLSAPNALGIGQRCTGTGSVTGTTAQVQIRGTVPFAAPAPGCAGVSIQLQK